MFGKKKVSCQMIFLDSQTGKKHIISLDTHSAFRHTLPSKIQNYIDYQMTKGRKTHAFDLIRRTWRREGDPG
jgi:hypothetical protein